MIVIRISELRDYGGSSQSDRNVGFRPNADLMWVVLRAAPHYPDGITSTSKDIAYIWGSGCDDWVFITIHKPAPTML